MDMGIIFQRPNLHLVGCLLGSEKERISPAATLAAPAAVVVVVSWANFGGRVLLLVLDDRKTAAAVFR